jgi:hypothetical protein
MLVAGDSNRFGVQTWYLVGGIATIVLALVMWMVPAVMKIEEGHTAADPTQPAEPILVTLTGD